MPECLLPEGTPLSLHTLYSHDLLTYLSLPGRPEDALSVASNTVPSTQKYLGSKPELSIPDTQDLQFLKVKSKLKLPSS